MAVETGTATGHDDLLVKLAAFLSTNAELVAAGQNWEVLDTAIADEKVFHGPGLAGADDIYITIRPYEDTIANSYNWDVRYATGHSPQEEQYQQPGVSRASYLTLWNLDIPYWFIANGRRFIVIAKVSTAYPCMYGGLILPYGLPSEFPYPVCVGTNATLEDARWSDDITSVSSFWFPMADGSDNTNYRAMLRLRDTAGVERNFSNGGRTSTSIFYECATLPYTLSGETNGQAYLEPRTSPDGAYSLQPIQLFRYGEGSAVYGEFDGVMHVSGFDNGTENTLTVGGKTYIVVQSTLRTGVNFYAAILLE